MFSVKLCSNRIDLEYKEVREIGGMDLYTLNLNTKCRSMIA